MGRRTIIFDRNRKQQRSKGGKDHKSNYPVNEMRDNHFDKGDKDGGFDNWRPYQDTNYPVDKTKLMNTSSHKELLKKPWGIPG